MNTFASETVKEKQDKFGHFKVSLKLSGYEGGEKLYQVVHSSFGNAEVFTYKTRKGAEKKYGYLIGGIIN